MAVALKFWACSFLMRIEKKEKKGVEVRFRENGMGFRLIMMNENHDNQTKVMLLL